MYSEEVMEHFRNPKNMGEMENPDAKARVGNPTCGDVMNVYVKIDEKDGEKYIEDIKFKTFGCAAAIATSSVLTELAKGKEISEAENITNSDVSESLNGLPKEKLHCSNLAATGLHEAIYQYKQEHEMEISEDLERKHEIALETLSEAEETRENLNN